MKPPALHSGDTIAIISTARWVSKDTLDQAQSALERKEFNVFRHPNNNCRAHEFAGSFEERAAALHDVWQDPQIKAVVIATGGNRTLHLLDYIDFDIIKAHQKIMIGYSDTTALLNSIYRKTGLVTFHGPDAVKIAKQPYPQDIEDMISLWQGGTPTYDLSSSTVLTAGQSRGKLIGGNLCILNYLLGTPFAPDFQDAILFIEDELEEIRNIDRMLLHLKRLGRLDQLRGLIIGGFTMVLNTGRVPFPYTLQELVTEMTDGLDIPVVMDAPFGHGGRLTPFPLGIDAELNAPRSGEISLKLREPAVAKDH